MPQLNWWTRRDTSTTGLLSEEISETTSTMENGLTIQEHKPRTPDAWKMFPRPYPCPARNLSSRMTDTSFRLPSIPTSIYQPEHVRASLSVDPTAMSVISSSAPTSPNSSLDEEDLIQLGTPHPFTTVTTTMDRRRRIPNRPTNLRTRRRPGFMTTCSPFFSRLAGVHSPYQSDISQSAPSSPTMDTYETLPLVENVVTMDGYSWGTQNSRGYLPTTVKNIFSKPNSVVQPSSECPDPALLHLLQRLGIQTVWPCLRDHGVIDLHRLGRLTRDDLIRMGINDAETRGTLVTASQMLSNKWLSADSGPPPIPPLLPNPSILNRGIEPTAELHPQTERTLLTEKQALHDSGCSSSNEFSAGNAATCRNGVAFEFSPNKHQPQQNTLSRATGSGCDRFWPAFTTMVRDGCQPLNQVPATESSTVGARYLPQLYAVTTLNSHCPARTRCPFENSPAHTGLDCCRDPPAGVRTDQPWDQMHGRTNRVSTISGRNPLNSVPTAGQSESNQVNKTPVGILRNARECHDPTRQLHSEKRSSSATPKCVKIDERSLLVSKQTNNPTMDQEYSQSMAGHSFLVEAPSSYQTLQHNTGLPIFTERMGPVAIQQEQYMLSWQRLRVCLQHEGIDLTQQPYSNEMGQANIPLRLTQRYAFELGWDLNMVAILMEAEREHRLREAGRPVVSFIDDIHSQRYLNCDGIKTGSIEDFLIGLGLPMYIDRVKHMINRNLNSPRPEQSITPAELLKMSDAELINELGFTAEHLDWLRREAAVIPSVLLTQLRSGFHTHHKMGPYINSLTREHKNTIQRHANRHGHKHHHSHQQHSPQHQRHGSQNREPRKDHF